MDKYRIFIIVFLLLLLPAIVEAAVTIKPNIFFKIKSENTYLHFEKESNFNKIVIKIDRIYFDDHWFKLKGADLTFKKFYENNNLIFELIGSPGTTSIVDMYSPSKPNKVKIGGIEQREGTTWVYTSSNQTLTIRYTF